MHGITVRQLETQLPPAERSTAGLQVIFGTAPVNLSADPEAAANKLKLCSSMEEALAAVGYSENCDWTKYTLCQSIYMNFVKFKTAPVVLVNVLDPKIHKTTVSEKSFSVTKRKCTVKEFGILQKTVTVKAEEAGNKLAEGTDYVLAFDDEGYLSVSLLSASSAASAEKLLIGYDVLNPEAVSEDDIIGGVSVDDDTETGLELIRQVYPRLGYNAGLILAPVWSKNPAVALAMEAKCENINGCFTADCMVDIDSSAAGARTRNAAKEQKEKMGVTSQHVFTYYPNLLDNKKIFSMSAVMAAAAVAQDMQSDGVAYRSPSNKPLYADGVVLEDGTEMLIDFEQADELNKAGICTAINRRGIHSWGNYTAAFPDNVMTTKKEVDPVKKWINIRRFFTWWSNSFINFFLDRVDDLANQRLVESVVDEENIRCNGFVQEGYCAAASVEYNPEKSDILNGKIVLRQKLTPFPPAESFINEVEYDVSALYAAMGGESDE